MSSQDFSELMVYYSYTLTPERKQEFYMAQLTYEVYLLRRAQTTDSSAFKKLEDFLVRPAWQGVKVKPQSQEEMMDILASMSGYAPGDIQNGNFKNSNNPPSQDGGV